jgi:hypothetical protein
MLILLIVKAVFVPVFLSLTNLLQCAPVFLLVLFKLLVVCKVSLCMNENDSGTKRDGNLAALEDGGSPTKKHRSSSNEAESCAQPNSSSLSLPEAKSDSVLVPLIAERRSTAGTAWPDQKQGRVAVEPAGSKVHPGAGPGCDEAREIPTPVQKLSGVPQMPESNESSASFAVALVDVIAQTGNTLSTVAESSIVHAFTKSAVDRGPPAIQKLKAPLALVAAGAVLFKDPSVQTVAKTATAALVVSAQPVPGELSSPNEEPGASCGPFEDFNASPAIRTSPLHYSKTEAADLPPQSPPTDTDTDTDGASPFIPSALEESALSNYDLLINLGIEVCALLILSLCINESQANLSKLYRWIEGRSPILAKFVIDFFNFPLFSHGLWFRLFLCFVLLLIFTALKTF